MKLIYLSFVSITVGVVTTIILEAMTGVPINRCPPQPATAQPAHPQPNTPSAYRPYTFQYTSPATGELITKQRAWDQLRPNYQTQNHSLRMGTTPSSPFLRTDKLKA
jgi:hypothetical protein